MAEGLGELVDDLALFGGQLIGIGGVHGGEVAVQQGIVHAADVDGLVLVVDPVQQGPVLHAVFGAAQDLGTLQLEEDDGDGLVHPGGEELVLLGVLLGIEIGHLDVEAGGVAVPVELVGENAEGPEADAVARLDDIQVVVADGVAQDRGHQGSRARGRAHPQNVVVAPLDVHTLVGHQAVHDDVRPGPPVEDVADDVQMVHGQGLDGGADGLNDGGCLADGDDGIDQVFKVIPLGAVLVTDVDQLVQDLPVVLRGHGPDLVPGVLDGDEAADLDQPVEGDAVPLLHVLLGLGHQLQLGLGVVDEGGQIVAVPLGEGGAEDLLQLLLDLAGAGV